MNDGGYSRIEKDFLGNERMVHYDASGNMLGASDVEREADGTIRISNDPAATSSAGDLPKVEAVVPTPKATTLDEPIGVRARASGNRPGMQVNQVVMYSIAAFIATSLLTLGVLSFLRSNGSDARVRVINVPSQRVEPQRNFDNPPDSQPERDNFPSDPRPRNDEQPTDTPPFDQGAPDSNMDDNRPRIRDNDPAPPIDTEPAPDTRPKKGGSDDPIDLRGDDNSKANPPKKGDPNGDPLKGDDIH